MMQFYMTPGSCSTGIHILLEELDLIFGVNIVNLPAGDHLTDAFKAINPKSTIPVLVTADGEALCDFLSIAWWLGANHPKAKLIPESNLEQARCIEFVNYVTGFIHGQGYTRIFTTDKYTNTESEKDAIVKQGHELVQKGLALVEDQLEGCGSYLFGEFGIADAALFYVLFWADRINLPVPPLCKKHYTNMLSRPKVRQVMAEEGYHSVLSRG